MNLNLSATYKSLFIKSLSVLTVLTLLVAVFSNLTAFRKNIEIFFCSDTLYLPSLYQDLFVDGNHISDWQLNPAPNYFPDMLFFFLLMLVTNNFIVTFFIFAIVQYLALGFLFVKILRLLFPAASAYYNLLIYSLLGFFTLEFFFFTRDFYYIFLVMINSYHTGAFVMALLCTYLSLNYFRNKKPKTLIAVFVIGFLMMLSDKLFIVLYVVPMCLSSLILFKRAGGKKVLVLIALCTAFVCLGSVVFKWLDTDIYNLMGKTGGLADADVMLLQLKLFCEQMYGYLTHFGVKALAIYLFILSFFMMIYVLVHSLKKRADLLVPFYALFSLVFSVAVICAPIAVGKYEGPDCIRYTIYPFYLAVLNTAVFIFYRLKSAPIAKAGRMALLGFNLVLLCVGFRQLSAAGLKSYFNYYPDNARLVDEVARREHLKYGVGNYWEAKEITMFSKTGVKVYAVFDDIAFYLHVANDKWFFNNMFNFVVLNDFYDTTLYRTRVKDIRYLSNTPELKLVKTRPFFYKRITGSTAITTETKDN